MPSPIAALLQRLFYRPYTPYIGIIAVFLFLAILEDHTLLPSVSELWITLVALFCGIVFVIAPIIYMLDQVKNVLRSLGEVVVYYKEQKEIKVKDAAERPRSYGFEYSDDEGEEGVQQRPHQDWSTASEPTPPKPFTVVDLRAASASPVGAFTSGHTPYPYSCPRPTWTPANTPPPPSSPFDDNPASATSALGTFQTTSPPTPSTAGHTPNPRAMAPPMRQMPPPLPPSVIRPNQLAHVLPTPHHASGLLGPSPAPKRMLSHFSPEEMHKDTAIREALFKKPGRPVREREGMFGSTIAMGMGESVGEAGLRRVRLRGSWRYVPVSEGGDGEYEGEDDDDKDEGHRQNAFKKAEKESPVVSEKARGKQKAASDGDGCLAG